MDICPKVIGIDHPTNRPCELQVAWWKKDRKDQSVATKDREDRSATVKDQKDQSVAAKD